MSGTTNDRAVLAERPHFLIATDLPAATPHVAFAARLGDRLRARVTLFHATAPLVLAVPEPVTAGVAEDDLRAAARGRLRELAMELGVATPPHVAVDVAVDPARAVREAAERLHADLVVLPTHARTGLKRALLGSIAEQVLRKTTHAVLLLTDAMVAAERRGDQPGPIVLATDLDESAGDAARCAGELARRLHLPLLLFSVVPTREGPPYGGGAPVAAAPTSPRDRVQERLRRLRRFGAEFANDLAPEAIAELHDDAAPAIVRTAAACNASFVVLATHARRGLARTLLGSVAERVVRTGTVPTIVVPLARE